MRLISRNSQNTFNNFLKDKSGLFKIAERPRPGDLAIWRWHDQWGNSTGKGHAGIVERVLGNKFRTVEGNTTSLVLNSREGLVVARKDHDLTEYGPIKQGLRLRGFIRYKYA